MDIKDVEKLAELAKIELGEDEKKKVLSDMEGILEYVKVVEQVEVEDTNVKHSVFNIWREDKEGSKASVFSDDLIIKQFPDEQDGFLKVKKIL